MFNVKLGLLVAILLMPLYIHAEQKTEKNGRTLLSPLKLGERIYQKGILSNGEHLTAIGKDGLPFKIKRTACMDCHRRSGLGSSESGILIPPITGDYLFKVSDKKGSRLLDRVGKPRPVYTEATLKALIHNGVRPDGRQLHEIMPRYQLGNSDMDYLIRYLKSLDKEPIPGLTDHQINMATVVTPAMSVDDKKLTLKILNEYIGNINKDVRQLGHMRNPLHGRYKPYRKWRLKIWELTGDRASWKGQLESLYKKEPVFLLLGGYGDWSIIHEFSEQNKVPALFPITDTPVISDKDFYTLYFSKGIYLDADVIGKQLIAINKRQALGTIYQVFNDESASLMAARALKNMLNNNGFNKINMISFHTQNSILSSLLNEIKYGSKSDVLVLWLNKKQTFQLLKEAAKHIPERIYLSSRLLQQVNPEKLINAIPQAIKNKVTLVHPFYLPTRKGDHLLRTRLWARLKGIPFTKQRIIANTYFGLVLLTGAINTSKYNLNREYLIEQFEHMIDNTVYRSVYPHLSLGPNQRYASKGTFVITSSSNAREKIEWVIPEKK